MEKAEEGQVVIRIRGEQAKYLAFALGCAWPRSPGGTPVLQGVADVASSILSQINDQPAAYPELALEPVEIDETTAAGRLELADDSVTNLITLSRDIGVAVAGPNPGLAPGLLKSLHQDLQDLRRVLRGEVA